MCGIAGAITRYPIPDSNVKRCLKSLYHRGPDNASFTRYQNVSDWNILQIHTRLSIIDLDPRSNQPMKIGNGSLVFNGEIYNYLELKSKFFSSRKLRTKSDTEILGLMLSEYGSDAFQKLEGMWSFSWFDFLNERLTLCRDGFGKKPLYFYLLSDGGMLFGSQPQAIFDLLGYSLPINRRHIERFLVNGYKSIFKTEQTFFSGLNQLPAGCYLSWTSKTFANIYQWDKYSFGMVDDSINFNDAVSGTRSRLIKSLELRLRSDVPLAFMLSGGIDSNALIFLAKKYFNLDISAFTIINDDQRYEESDMVNLAIRQLNINHFPVKVCHLGIINDMRELIKLRGSPIFTISQFAQTLLMKEISNQGFKVTLSGIGADEIFSGYYDHHNAYLRDMYFKDKSLFEESRENWSKTAGKYVRNEYLKDPDYFIKKPFSRDHIYFDSTLYSSYLISGFYEPFEEKYFCNDLLRNRMANEITYEAVPPLVHEEDLNSMSYSVENRCPYLDNELLKWANKIPTKFLIRDGLAKAILRHAVKDLVPNKIIMNPRKVGFNVPIDSFLDLENKKNTVLLNENSPIYNIVNYDKVLPLLTPKKKRSNTESKFIFNMLSSNLFLENF